MEGARAITSKIYGELGRFVATRRPSLYRSPSGRVLVLGEGALGGKGEGILYLDKVADGLGFRVPRRSLVVCDDYFGIPALPMHRARELDSQKSQEFMDILGEEKFPARLAIRSSSVMEDQPGHSAAGVFLSKYHDPQRFEGDLLSDIIEVLNSNYKNRALIYQRSRGMIEIPPLPMIVQELIGTGFKYAPRYFFPAMAGIVNTASPKGIKVATVPGFGVATVDGGWGTLHTFDRDFRLREEGGAMPSWFRVLVKGQPHGVDPKSEPHQYSSAIRIVKRNSPKVQARLARVAANLGNRLGAPLDIEWAIDNEGAEPYLLQIRPIKPKRNMPKPVILPADIRLETPEVIGQASHSFSHVIVMDCSDRLDVDRDRFPNAGQLMEIGSLYPNSIVVFIENVTRETPYEISELFPYTRAVVVCEKNFDANHSEGTGLQHLALRCTDENKLIFYLNGGWGRFVSKIEEMAKAKRTIEPEKRLGIYFDVYELPEPHNIAGSDEDGWGMIYRGEPHPPRN